MSGSFQRVDQSPGMPCGRVVKWCARVCVREIFGRLPRVVGGHGVGEKKEAIEEKEELPRRGSVVEEDVRLSLLQICTFRRPLAL